MIYRTILNETSESMCNFRTFYFNIYLFCNFAFDNHLLTQAKAKYSIYASDENTIYSNSTFDMLGKHFKMFGPKGSSKNKPVLRCIFRGLSPRTTIELGAGLNWFTPNKASSNKKLVHWLGTMEYRYWTCERFSGHFWGIHIIGTQYNIAGHHLPLLFGDNSSHYRYEGWGAGGGISYGYHFLLSNRWSLEANIGAGYVRLHYDKFRCKTCGEKVGTENRNYFGPTKAAISLIFLIK